MKHMFGKLPEYQEDATPYTFHLYYCEDNKSLSHFVFIEACLWLDRFEQKGCYSPGSYTNMRECIIVDDYLRKLMSLRKDEDLHNGIYITAGYNSQVDSLSGFLNQPDSFLARHPEGEHYVKIATVDSVQGHER